MRQRVSRKIRFGTCKNFYLRNGNLAKRKRRNRRGVYLLFFTGAKFIVHLFITYPISISPDTALSSARKQSSVFWLCSTFPLDKTRHLFLGGSATKLRPPIVFYKIARHLPLDLEFCHVMMLINPLHLHASELERNCCVQNIPLQNRM